MDPFQKEIYAKLLPFKKFLHYPTKGKKPVIGIKANWQRGYGLNSERTREC
jgi:hypothetical protein